MSAIVEPDCTETPVSTVTPVLVFLRKSSNVTGPCVSVVAPKLNAGAVFVVAGDVRTKPLGAAGGVKSVVTVTGDDAALELPSASAALTV